MTDPDIQYIGNWSSEKPISNLSALNVSAFILTTEDDSKFRLTFSRNQFPVVLIGRSPSSNDPKGHEGRATYSNPLMSRSHAKITFSDSDSVSLTDIHSHHGTWINRESGNIKLTPDKPFRLEDGDKITFGKGVVKDGILHTPLVVSVKLLFNPSTPPSVRPKSCSVTPEDNLRSSRGSRNRFGLSLSSSSESELSSDFEEAVSHHDDVETSGIRTSSSLFGLESPQSNPDPLSLSRPVICEPLPPMDPGVENVDGDGDGEPVRADHSAIVPDSQTSSATPPWRRFPHSPWFDVTSVTTSLLRHVPDILPRPFSRSESLFGSRTSKSDVNPQEPNIPHRYSTPDRHAFANGHTLASPLLSHHSHSHHHHHPHPHSHNHHHHHRHDVDQTGPSDEEVKILGDDIRMLKEELQSLRTIVSRLDQTHITNDQVQSLLKHLENKVPDLSLKAAEEHMSSFKPSFESFLEFIEQAIADLKRTIPGLQSKVDASEAKFSAFQNDIEKTQHLQERVDNVHFLYLDALEKWSADHVAVEGCRNEVDTIRKELAYLCETRNERKIDEDEAINSDPNEGELESRLKEYIDTELSRLMRAEFNSVLGKRKRSDDEEHDHVDVHVQTIEDPSILPTPSMGTGPPPTKRLKTLKSYIVPGVIGAVSAWLGLAYL